MDMIRDRYGIDEMAAALGVYLEERWEAQFYDTFPSGGMLPAMYVEKQADEKWKHDPDSSNQHERYEIVENGREDFSYNVRVWHEIEAERWAYTGDGIFCKTLEQANDYIDEQKKYGSNVQIKITKSDENIREVHKENGDTDLFCKRYGVWWPAYKNDKDEVYPSFFAIGNDDEFIQNNLERMLADLQKSGVKEIDFSNCYFTNVCISESMMKNMKFADKINFQNAGFLLSNFTGGQMKNADFSGASFDMSGFVKTTLRNCNFNGAFFSAADQRINKRNVIHDSTFIGCNFENAQLNDTEIKNSKFTRSNIDRKIIKGDKQSILSKLNEFKQSVEEDAEAKGADRDTRQRDPRQEER